MTENKKNTNNTSSTIDLLDLLRYLLKPKKILVVVAAAVAAVAILFLYNLVTFVPEYESKSTLYVVKQNSGADGNTTLSASDFSMALDVVNDCTYIIKMETVLDQVIKELNLDTDYETLRRQISTNNPNGTRILEVKATASTPELAEKIAEVISRVGAQKINSSLGFKQVNISEEARITTVPCNKPGLRSYVLAGMLSAVVACGIYVVLYLTDDGIHSDDDVEQYLNLSVLGRIPDFAIVSRQSNYRYGYTANNRKLSKKLNV